MKHFFVLSIILFSAFVTTASPVISLKKGLIITSSVTISRETYYLNADTSMQVPLIIIEGKNITVDFNDCILQGSNDKDQPNEFYGLAVFIKKGSSNINIINANIHGFKIAVMADSVQHLQISNCDFSYNYRQHLHSNWKREDVSDWMSYHHNEHDEWMRYGAGMYLKDCRHAIIKDNFITGGQCGLMMMRCDSNEIYANNFSFNSGIGIGLYRSSDNKIYANQLDFNVRGYSDGIYYRGQDSAGILVFEQCNNNMFVYNSVTHSGDGFFLWAGQYTMDTGEGGCNDNLIFGNDFSYAPTNGVEVTFSTNKIESNIIKDCDNGIWGGYSYSTEILQNQFAGNKTAIAIEHGQHVGIVANHFTNDKTAIKLWARAQQPPDWMYAKKRDTKSKQYIIWNNHFDSINVVYDLMGTDSIKLTGNQKQDCNTIFKLGKRISNLDTSDKNANNVAIGFTEPRLKNLTQTKIPTQIKKPGRSQIHITEWGPYDFRYPLLWLKNIDSIGLYHFDVLTPSINANHKTKNWKLKSVNGFSIIQNANNQITAKADSSVQDRSIQLEYNGLSFTDAFGKRHSANKPYIFQYKEFDPHFNWSIDFYKWDSINDPQKDYASFIQSLQQPVYSTTQQTIDYTWWGAIGNKLPADSFATVATSTIQLKEGNYSIGITADDLAKLFIDGKEIINAWDATYTALDENTNHEKIIHLSGGKHEFKIVHAEISGLATLMFYMKPANISLD
ncbi:MAG TPA: right-handed parallel beta-helix repeat-containing protein [Parafilimonas sp.]|nr:right-handed parallel beta-helix repeat-containing protein [Parafilimonas sp.]